jgi:C4-type Zn-finger protein
MTVPDGGHVVATGELIALVRTWRGNETRPVTCPCCQAPGLEIHDRSARPYREWYAISCNSCGFEKTVSVALAAAIPGVD